MRPLLEKKITTSLHKVLMNDCKTKIIEHMTRFKNVVGLREYDHDTFCLPYNRRAEAEQFNRLTNSMG